MSKKTIVVNLFAGAGAGKTTCAWEIASELKKRGIETEYVSEYAKELVWDNNMEMLDGSLGHQQTGRIHTLQECKVIDNKIKEFLKSNDIYFGTYYHSTVNVLVDNIVKNLNNVNMKEKIYKSNITELRNTYPEGTRIEIEYMNDPQAVPSGTRGTVDYIDDAGQIHIKWDNGSSLAILPNEDNFRTLTNEEQLKEIDNFRNEPDICDD